MEATLQLVYEYLNKPNVSVTAKSKEVIESEQKEEIVTSIDLDSLVNDNQEEKAEKNIKYKKYDIKEIYNDFLKKKRKKSKH